MESAAWTNVQAAEVINRARLLHASDGRTTTAATISSALHTWAIGTQLTPKMALPPATISENKPIEARRSG